MHYKLHLLAQERDQLTSKLAKVTDSTKLAQLYAQLEEECKIQKHNFVIQVDSLSKQLDTSQDEVQSLKTKLAKVEPIAATLGVNPGKA